ncbi:MAG: hypothetical protein K6E13_03760 [Lachnospiraceae bacterium]|nr:hypothetical protein [Lachnospiraceae bacterium]
MGTSGDRERNMERIKTELEEKLSEIKKLLKRSNRNINALDYLPDAHIRMSSSRGYEQYYYVDNKSKTRSYIKKSEIEKYRGEMQRDYEKLINKRLKKIQRQLSSTLKNIEKIKLEEIDEIYEKMSQVRKDVIVPIRETDELYKERWKAEHPGKKNTFPIKGNVYTAKGECVRSKSEKIIADLFDKYGIEYSYEPKLIMEDGHAVYPDFVLLNIRKRKTMYWEHLGMIDDADYAVSNMKKMMDYERSGYKIGEHLIFTMESVTEVLNSKDVEEKIKRYCL